MRCSAHTEPGRRIHRIGACRERTVATAPARCAKVEGCQGPGRPASPVLPCGPDRPRPARAAWPVAIRTASHNSTTWTRSCASAGVARTASERRGATTAMCTLPPRSRSWPSSPSRGPLSTFATRPQGATVRDHRAGLAFGAPRRGESSNAGPGAAKFHASSPASVGCGFLGIAPGRGSLGPTREKFRERSRRLRRRPPLAA